MAEIERSLVPNTGVYALDWPEVEEWECGPRTAAVWLPGSQPRPRFKVLLGGTDADGRRFTCPETIHRSYTAAAREARRWIEGALSAGEAAA